MAMSSSSVRIREFQSRDPGSNPGIVTITLTEHGFLLGFQLPPADATKEDRRPICGLAVGREYNK